MWFELCPCVLGVHRRLGKGWLRAARENGKVGASKATKEVERADSKACASAVAKLDTGLGNATLYMACRSERSWHRPSSSRGGG